MREGVSIEGLEKEEFKIQEIDLGEKGYLTVEDLVCFINLNSGSYFRNRDVCCMFRRWNKVPATGKLMNRLDYGTFLNFMAK